MLKPSHLFVLLAVSLSASAETLIPVVASVTENATGTQITVSDDDFGSTRPTLTIAGVNLAVLSSSDGAVVAQVPAGTAPGSYLLTVQNNNSHFAGIFALVLGTQGPAGPARPQGPQGLPGL